MATDFKGRRVSRLSWLIRLRSLQRHRGVVRLALLLALPSVLVAPALAQQRNRPRQQQHRMSNAHAHAANIDASASVAVLFQRAEEGIAREDWKFAIDSLQRIIEDPEGSLIPDAAVVTQDGVQYECERLSAARRLGRLPPEGLQAYRLLYDGVARGLLQRAIARHDSKALRTILERYSATTSAVTAADLLSSWALDAGRPAEVLVVLEYLRDVSPTPDSLDDRAVARLVLANAMLGRTDQAKSIATEFRETRATSPELGKWLDDLAAGKVPAQWDAAWMEAFDQVQPPDDLGSWPIIGGWPSRIAVMPTVNPVLTDMLPWRFDLPEEPVSAWEQRLLDRSSDLLELPAPCMVTDENRLFVRIPGAVAALDLEDLQPLWRAIGSAPAPLSGSTNENESSWMHADRTLALAGDSVADWHDTVRSAISLAGALVLTIEKAERESSLPMRFIDRVGSDADGAALLVPNKLVARDAQTGQRVWELGGTFDFADPLGHAIFRAVPIEVGGALWVPYLEKKDLYCAVLDPTDGSLLHNILLCSLEQPWLYLDRALDPAYANGMVYVPTDHGMLFAIDADEPMLRWAFRYVDHGGESGNTTPFPDFSLSSSPVCAGRWVLLNPVDDPELLALNADTGAFAWSNEVEGASYILAADESRVWLGGWAVSCLSLATGRPIWTTALSATPSGKAVRSGPVIYAPTYDGLTVIDSHKGEVIEQRPLSPNGRPLGSILCLNSAMYARDAEGVRKLPDPEKLRAAALARIAADASDGGAALQLAWLELLDSHPRRALDILGANPNGGADGSERYRLRIAHARVEALLALAADSADTAAALQFLDQAQQEAHTPSERIRCGLARADRNLAADQFEEAFHSLLDLSLGKDGDHVVEIGQHVKGAARLEIAQRLESIKPKLAPEQAAAADELVMQEVVDGSQQLISDEGVADNTALLSAVSDLHSLGTAPQRALLGLGAWGLKHRRYEEAEQLLARCVRMDADPEFTAAALMLLCESYTQAGQLLGEMLHERLDVLQSRFANAKVPAEFTQSIPQELAASDVQSIGSWVTQLRSKGPEAPTRWYLEGTQSSPPPGFRGTPVIGAGATWWLRRSMDRQRAPGARSIFPLASFPLPDEIERAINATRTTEIIPRLIQFEGANTGALDGRVLSYVPGNWVICHDSFQGRILWHTRLRLPGSFSDDNPIISLDEISRIRQGVIDGQSAVIAGQEGLFGIGIATGRRLWVRPYDRIEGLDDLISHETALACRNGLVAATPRSGYLTLLRSGNGKTVWERRIRGESVSHIWMRGDRVVTADQRMQRVYVFDVRNGSLVSNTRFVQPNADGPPVDLSLVGGFIVGPDCTTEADSIVAFPLQGDSKSGTSASVTSSKSWRLTLDKPLGRVFTPDDRYLGVSMLGGDVLIVDNETGEEVFRQRVPDGRVAVDGRLIDATLVLLCGPATAGNPVSGMIAFDLATKEILWQRDDILAMEGPQGPLRVNGGYIPAVVVRREDANQPARSISLVFIDFKTGAESETAAELHGPGARPTFNGDCTIRSNAIVVGTSDGLMAFPISVQTPDQGGAS